MSQEVFLTGYLQAGDRLILNGVKQGQTGRTGISVDRITLQINGRQVCRPNSGFDQKPEFASLSRNSQVTVKENEIVKIRQRIANGDGINSRGGRGGEVAIPDGSRNYDRLIEVIDGVPVNKTFDRGVRVGLDSVVLLNWSLAVTTNSRFII